MDEEVVRKYTNYKYFKIDEHGNICYFNDADKLHRLDGPALEWSRGYKSWWINGRVYTEKEWEKICCPSVEEAAAMFNALTTAQ